MKIKIHDNFSLVLESTTGILLMSIICGYTSNNLMRGVDKILRAPEVGQIGRDNSGKPYRAGENNETCQKSYMIHQ
jgi:hypothetical protein